LKYSPINFRIVILWREEKYSTEKHISTKLTTIKTARERQIFTI